MNDTYKEIKKTVNKMRISALEMGFSAGGKGAHFGAGLSAMEIFGCLYGGIMNIDSKYPENPDRDYLVLGKAHCVLAYYTALSHAGYFSKEDLDMFDQDGSELMGHPVMNLKRGIEFSGGSLGMALSQGVGLALSFKMKQKKNYVYVLLGDGECQEGAVWEAAMSAAHFSLDNIILIVDKNMLQYDGNTDEIMGLGDLKQKFESFGFCAFQVDGHSVTEIYDALIMAKKCNGKPSVIIADTIKGKGISFMENAKEWHHKAISKEQYEEAINELGEV